jgi:hypothetical protein
MAELTKWQILSTMYNQVRDSVLPTPQRINDAVGAFLNSYTTALDTVQGTFHNVLLRASPEPNTASRKTTLGDANQHKLKHETEDESGDDLVFLIRRQVSFG